VTGGQPELDLEVGPVASGGMCVARDGDRVVFVRHALPGELVRARITEQRARYARADAVEVLRASPDRVSPPCQHAGPGRCGGCDWQHAALPAQRAGKAAVIREQLRRLAGLDVEVEVEALAGCPDGLGWRTRVQFAVGADAVVGLRRHRSHEIEPLTACPLAHPLVEDLGVERRRWPGAALVEVAVAAATRDRAVVVTAASGGVEPFTPPLDAAHALLTVGRDGPLARHGRPGVRERAFGRQFRVSGRGFWQVHPAAAETFSAAVCAFLAPRPGERAVDLYSGVGLFAAALAERVGAEGRVTAVESDRDAAADAAVNLADLPQVQVLNARVDPRRLGSLGRSDVVVLDPPRAGAGAAVVAAIVGLRPRAVAYVACDPSALARDVASFAAQGYRLTGLRAFDAFPMTGHVECIGLLVPEPR